MNGEELFGKEYLGIKHLKKLTKGELVSELEVNLQELTNYYFGDQYRKDVNDSRSKNSKINVADALKNLVTCNKLFLKPVAKIYKESSEYIPDGLPFIILDGLNMVKWDVRNALNNLKNSNLPKQEIVDKENAYQTELAERTNDVMDCLAVICKKTVKKLTKIGVNEEYAVALAPILVPGTVLTPQNIRRFVNNITNTICDVYRSSLVTEDATKVSDMGVNLADPKVLNKVIEIMTKDMDTGTFAAFIENIMLQKVRGDMDKDIIPIYSAITTYALSALEDKDVFSKKNREKIIRNIGDRRRRDAKNNNDGKRRVSFDGLHEDAYPHIVKSFRKITSNKD